MRRIQKAGIAALAMTVLGTGGALAAPANNAAVGRFSTADSSVTKVKDADRGLVFQLDVTATGYAGFSLKHAGGEAIADVAAPAFDFKAPAAAESGGSPRLVVRLSDGGDIEVRPESWSGAWQTVDSTTSNVDSNGGTCGYRYNTSWSAAQACHAGTTVVDAFVVTDSGWKNGAYTNLIDDVQFDGITYGASANG